MSNLRKHLLTCALLAGTSLAASAQTATPPAAPQGQAQHRFDPAKRAQFVATRLADLKQKLQIQPNQESAWASFAAAMQPGNLQRPDRQALANLSTPDRIDQMRALRNQRNADMDRRADATKAFYAQLTSEQKKTFDAETARHHGSHGGMHRHQQG